MADLARLSAGERQALRLLAQGHTAKSIAAELGISEGAVNERLREARRKTGAGSSRELARRLRSAEAGLQGNRDEEIGVAAAARGGEAAPGSWRPGWPLLIGGLIVILLAAGVGALTAVTISDKPAPAPPRVVATSPAPGAAVPAGPLTLTVTFDQPMTAGSYSFTGDPRRFPACAGQPVQSPDRRSFSLSCRVEAGRRYEIGFNNAAHRNFRGESGVPATPSVLRFEAR